MLFRMKNYSEKLLFPLGLKISNVKANTISIFGFIMAIIVFLGFTYNYLWVAILGLFFIEFFDQFDGVVARIQGCTDFGGFLDSSLDRYGDILVYYGLYVGGYVEVHLLIAVIAGSLLTSYTRARIEAARGGSVGGVGIFERTDRIPFLMLAAIIHLWYDQALFLGMIILAIGTNYTVFQRFRYASRTLSHIQNVD